jgi:hexosaminidase
MKRLKTLAFIIALGFFCVQAFAQSASVTDGSLSVTFDARNGLSAQYNGIPIILASTIQVYSPGWTQVYFSNFTGPVTVQKNGNQITVTYQSAENGFKGVETLDIQNQTIQIRLTADWQNPNPASIEFNLGQIWAPPFVGSQLSGTGGFIQKDIPIVTQSSGNNAVSLAANYTQLNMTGKVCNISVTLQDIGNSSTLLDGRNTERGWAQSDPDYWLGLLGIPLKSNQTITCDATLAFSPGTAAPPVAPSPTLSMSNQTVELYHPGNRPVLVPLPKQTIWGGKPFLFPSTKEVTCWMQAKSPKMQLIRHNLAEWLERLAGVKLRQVLEKRNANIRLDINPKAGRENPQGYDLTVNTHGATVTGHDIDGLFNGVQTLTELVIPYRKSSAFAACKIIDWPSLAFRGAHLFVGVNALPFEKKLINRVLSHMKMNNLVIECEFVKWKTDPKIWTNFCMSKSDLRKEVEYSRLHFMEPIPLIETLGHAEWMFMNGQNRQWAEKTNGEPHEYSPTAPGIYDFVHKIYDEAIDIFHPRIFHIGHDEININGKYPVRPADIQLGTTRIFNDDVRAISSWLAKKGIRTMLWGDMMLSRDEVMDGSANAVNAQDAQSSRSSLLPGDIVADWHYGGNPILDFLTSLSLFKAVHVPVVASTWYDPMNIRNFTLAAIQDKCLGTLQTNWSGWNISEQTLLNAPIQYIAYILSADYAWSGRKDMPNSLPYVPSNLFRRLWYGSHNPSHIIRGKLLHLPSATPDPGIGAPMKRYFDGFDLGLLNGRLDFYGALSNASSSKSAMIPVNEPVRGVLLAGGCRYKAAANSPILEITYHYLNGSVATVKIKYGFGINAVTDPNPLLGADIIPAGEFGGQSLHWTLWQGANPYPTLTVKSLEITSVHPYVEPFVGAVGVY